MLISIRNSILAIPRPAKRLILIVFDFFALSFAVWAAYSLRLGFFLIPDKLQIMVIVAAPLSAFIVFVRFGLYRAVIRYLPERAFWTITNAVIIATLIWVGVLFLLEISRFGTVPRSLPLIYSVLAILIVASSRFGAKYLLWTPMRRKYSSQIVIYGAGAAGSQLVNALRQEGSKYVVGFLDDDASLQGTEVAGIRVYSPSKLDYLIDSMGVSEVILSIPSVDSNRRQKIIADLSHHQIKIRALPALSSLASGQYLISQVREINIDDILGRSSVPVEPELLSQMIEGRSILISGAGGSIGSELSRLVVKWKPSKLVLFEANEFALYQIERALRKRTNLTIIPILGSVCDKALVRRVIRGQGVQVVFHAAAHKHVPLVEANALEGIRNNVFGTDVIARTSLDNGVENFILISSDKAVRPTNVMGATKRWAEIIISDCANIAKKNSTEQLFSTVRFGNVLGSNGSVVPLFKEQISTGGPVTVTDEEMTRYFMSIHEAAELIVQAGALSKGNDIFLLDMGKPIRIIDLAKNMIRLAGLSIISEKNSSGDIAISFIGRRPGEKTHEELFYNPDTAKPTKQSKILRSTDRLHQERNLMAELKKLKSAFNEEDEIVAKQILFDFIKDKKAKSQNNKKIVQLSVAKK
jgi:FlaA1/EpsC-like NDP-sugar epimerase